ncbi:TPA: hypothetical protein ACTYZW_000574 [Citrobacter freundii]
MLNENWIVELSKKLTPTIKVNYIDNMYRHEIVNGADDLSCVGIELGVAKGIFSKEGANKSPNAKKRLCK